MVNVLLKDEFKCNNDVILGTKETGNVIIKNILKRREEFLMEEIIEDLESHDNDASNTLILNGGNLIVGRKNVGITKKILLHEILKLKYNFKKNRFKNNKAFMSKSRT